MSIDTSEHTVAVEPQLELAEIFSIENRAKCLLTKLANSIDKRASCRRIVIENGQETEQPKPFSIAYLESRIADDEAVRQLFLDSITELCERSNGAWLVLGSDEQPSDRPDPERAVLVSTLGESVLYEERIDQRVEIEKGSGKFRDETCGYQYWVEPF